jgi:hypothetical protein
MKFNEHKHWNEFRWEKELKKQDNCVATYIKELDSYIDLPNESKLILQNLKKKKYINVDSLIKSNLFSDEKDINESLFADSPESRNNIKLFVRLGTLASDFNIILAKQNNPELVVSGLKVLSSYGKLISHFLDFIDLNTEEATLPPLRIALSKRIISSINTIIGEQQSMSAIVPDEKNNFDKQIIELLFFRETIIDLQCKCKNTK